MRMQSMVPPLGLQNCQTWRKLGWYATDICVKEISRLTDTARKGKFHEEAKSLRLPSHSVKIELLRSFSIPNLLKLYESATPHLQGLFKAIIGKKITESDEELVQRRQRNPDMVKFESSCIYLV
jgi:hypothetical protein